MLSQRSYARKENALPSSGKKLTRFTMRSTRNVLHFVLPAFWERSSLSAKSNIFSWWMVTQRRSRGFSTTTILISTNILKIYPHIGCPSFRSSIALCHGLDFALPQPVSPMEIQATFEKAYWKLEPKLSEENRELAAATLRSIALNYIKRKGPTPPKSMLRAIGQLKKRDDIVITRPDKGSGVVILDKTEYVSLLKESSISDGTKFIPISLERPKSRGRPPKHYHPYLKRRRNCPLSWRKFFRNP